MKIIRLTALSLLAASAPLAAQTAASAPVTTTSPTPAKPADPAATAAARELLQVSDYKKTLRDGLEKPLAAMRSGATLSAQLDANPAMRMQRAKNPGAWSAALERIGAKQASALDSVITAMLPEIEAKTVDIYAANFSAAELREITGFYRTPLGKMMMQRLPGVMSDTMMWVQSEMPARLAPAMLALAPEIQREIAPLMPQQQPPAK